MSYSQTRTGRRVYFANPQPEQFHIDDIAHALSNICRFTGHTKTFYSVAQHCCMASDLVMHHCKYEALMHDASEAYLSDIASPLKALLVDYQNIEARMETVLRSRFLLPAGQTAAVKHADLVCLGLEKRDLLSPDLMDPDEEWEMLEGLQLPLLRVDPWSPAKACLEFLDRFDRLAPPVVRAIMYP